jgi:ArsR family transcriptional regulator, arsenate/arsenite/antimonite-responsive transcriptional repressor
LRSSAQDAFDALSDPTRRAILDFLARSGEVTAGAIAGAVDGVGRTAVSSHLRVLRTSGLIEERREGRFRYYELAADGPVRDALAFLQSILRVGVSDAATATAQPPGLATAQPAGLPLEAGDVNRRAG